MNSNANPQETKLDPEASGPRAVRASGLAQVTFEDTPMPHAQRALREAIEHPPTDPPDSSDLRSGIVSMREPLPDDRLEIDVDNLPPPPSLRPPDAAPLRLHERLEPRKILRRVLDLIQDFVFARSFAFAAKLAGSTWHSGYDSLHVLFRSVQLKPGEIVVDIGSGLGRVVAFLSRRFKGHKVIGVEADQTALFAQRIFAKNPNVEIRHGDFIESYPAEATMFYIYPPTEGDFLRKLKGLIDQQATADTTVVARGALGGLGYFRADPSWTIEPVAPPASAIRRFVSTYFIYEHHRRGLGYHYGVILRKMVSAAVIDSSKPLPAPPRMPHIEGPSPASSRSDRR